MNEKKNACTHLVRVLIEHPADVEVITQHRVSSVHSVRSDSSGGRPPVQLLLAAWNEPHVIKKSPSMRALVEDAR